MSDEFYDAHSEDSLQESLQDVSVSSQQIGRSFSVPSGVRSDIIAKRELVLRPISLMNEQTPRTKIPNRPDAKINLWSIIKNAIGKDLTKIPMPVNFNEPLSLLQRVTEPLQYADLLDSAAAAENDTLLQLVYLAGFSISSYSSNAYRTTKPFNPLLNETYELDRTADLGWRSICEQVTHHPPACTLFAEGRGWNYLENFNAKSKFRGKYLTVDMLGLAQVTMTRTGHQITWNKVTCTVNNIIIGTLSIDQTGKCTIINYSTGEVCELDFHAHGLFNRSARRKVTGLVKDKNNMTQYVIEGKWDERVSYAKVVDIASDGTLATGDWIDLWSISSLPEGAENMYNFSEFTCSLNQLEAAVAPTDSRNRLDQRVMEEGDFSSANRIKSELEHIQRARRNQALNTLKEQGGALPAHCDEAIDPVWFVVDTNPKFPARSTLYNYKGGYWEAKSAGDWSMCPTIFTEPPPNNSES